MSGKKLITAATDADWAAVANVFGIPWTQALRRALAADDREFLDVAAKVIGDMRPLARIKLVMALSPECKKAVHEFYRSNNEET